MKKYLIFPILLIALLFTASITVCAEGEYTYTVTQDGDHYYLNKGGAVTAESDDLSALLLPLARLGEPICFEGVTTDKELVLTDGDYSFTGELTATAGITVEEGSRLHLEDISLELGRSSVSVKGGTLTVVSGSISSQGTAIRTSYTSSASAVVYGGRISSASSSPALELLTGSACLYGGEIVNTAGAAISCRATLRLCAEVRIEGASYGIITQSPIWASIDGESFEGQATVKYLSEFADGSETVIIYSAKEDMTGRFTVTDSSGREYPLVYRNGTLSVYLPYTVRFLYSGRVIAEAELLAGDSLVPPDFVPPIGYTESGWYTDAACTERYDPASKVISDLTLYAGCTLDRPTFSLQSLSFTYDGTEHMLGFSTLEHPLDGIFGYEWIDSEGRTVSTSSTLPVSKVADSGEYKCKLYFTYGSDTVSVETPFVSVNVLPLTVDLPAVPETVYDGTEQYPEILPIGFSYERIGFTDAGIYYVPLELTDPENTRFPDGSTTVTVSFTILQAQNEWLVNLSIKDAYFGAEPNAYAVARYGNAQYVYSVTPDGEYTSEPPTAVGAYYVRAVVRATDNFSGIVSEPIRFSVLEDTVVSVTVITHPTVSVYTAFELFDPTGLTLSVRYMSGKEETVQGDEASFAYMTADSFRTADSGIILRYMGHTLILPVTVVAAEYDYDFVFEDSSIVYDGKYHSLTYSGGIPVGLDGVSPTYRILGGGSDAGVYSVVIEFYTDSLEYVAPSSLTATLVIEPREVEVVWGETSFVYDGAAKQPTAFYRDIYGASVELAVHGAASLAGNGYIATAVVSSENYLLKSDTVTFEILPADYDLSAVTWSVTKIPYDGQTHTVTVSGLPAGISVVGYTDNVASNAGVYRATVLISYDTDNYNPPTLPPHTWEITPIEYPTTSFSFLGGTYTYDGKAHFPILSGELPVGVDGSSLYYSFSRSVTDVADSGTVTVSFVASGTNYLAPQPINVTVTVVPKGINVVWSSTELVYNARAQSPAALSSECSVYVSEGNINAGEYTATAYTDDLNYSILNGSIAYRIIPAPNVWTEQLTVSDIFFGTEPAPSAAALYGTVEYAYYVDESLTRMAELPLSVGSYYAVALADAGRNYSPLTSAPVKFSVIAIVPVALRVSGRTEYTAFDTVSDADHTFTLINNDGSTRELTLDDIVTVYGSADSLRAADTTITFCYGSVSATLEINVSPAEYDMSSVRWENTHHVYDGTAKHATLSGLPDGVSVEYYVGSGEIGAGEYVLGAVLSYDSANYLEPDVPEATLIIERCPLTPCCISTTYNGRVQYPISDSSLYIPDTVGFTDAGEYTVSFTLKDSDNYYLTSETATFTVLPRVLCFAVGDEVEYWFAPVESFTSVMTSGSLAEGDDPELYYYVEDGLIYVATDDPNYSLSVTAGRLDSRFGFAPEVTRALFIFLLAFLLLGCLMAVIIIRREPILVFISTHRPRHRTAETEGEDSERIPMGEYLSVDVERADELITDGIARTLIRPEEESVFTEGTRRVIINVDTLAEKFAPGERVDINVLKARGIVPADAGYLKVLGRGVLDKPLRVYANAFSLSAVKMIALTGGEVYRVKKM